MMMIVHFNLNLTNLLLLQVFHTRQRSRFNSVHGRLAQLVERTLSMREVGGSKPPLSILYCFVFILPNTMFWHLRLILLLRFYTH